jgi:RNA polymerase sigma-70 factor (ECF subfamily)
MYDEAPSLLSSHGDSMTELNVSDVVERAQSGSTEAIGTLYTCFSQRIYRFLYFRTGDIHIAEDLTGEVFLKMVQALPNYHQDGSPFQAWLYQIARNLAVDHFRRDQLHPVIEINEDLDWEAGNLDTAVDFHFSCEELSRGLLRLDETHRDVLLLRFIEGMPIAETARTLNKSIDAVKALQRRGLTALRRILNHGEDGHA